VTKRSNRTRGTRPDRKRYDLKAKAIDAGRNRTRGGIPPQVPFFTLNPITVEIAEFGSAQFTATAESPDTPPSPILGYQWQYRIPPGDWLDAVDGPGEFGTVVSGSQTQTLTLSNVSGNADGVEVRCSATNQWGTGYSRVATIVITSGTWFILTEDGNSVVDEPATNFVVDERSD
jgi:hypothetical protein